MRRILFILLILVLITPVALYLVREPLIKIAINKVGSSVVQTNVSVENVTFQPFNGLLALNGLKVANPQGYSNNNAIEVAGIKVQLEPKSLLSGAIQINEISVSGPQIRLEGGLKTNNLTALQANLPTAGAAAPTAPAQAPAANARPVEIDLLQIADGRITITSPVAATANLGTITLKDIGKEGSTAKIADVVGLVMNQIMSIGTSALTGELGQKGRALLDGVTGEAEGNVKSITDKIGGKLKGFFGK